MRKKIALGKNNSTFANRFDFIATYGCVSEYNDRITDEESWCFLSSSSGQKINLALMLENCWRKAVCVIYNWFISAYAL